MRQIGALFVLGVVALAACEPDTRKKKSSDDDDGGGGATTTIGAGGSTTVGVGGSTTVGTGGSSTTTTSTTTGAGGCNHPFEIPPSPCADCLEAMCCSELTACGNDGVCSACLTGQQEVGCDTNGPLLDLSDCAYGYCPAECG